MSLFSSPKALFPTLGSCPPASVVAAASILSGWLQVPAGATKLKVTCLAGAVGTTPTHSLSAQQATSGAGAGAKNVVGLAGTFGTVANTVAQFDFDLTQLLDLSGGFNFIQLTITNGSGTASIIGAEFETGPGPYLA